MTKITHVRPSEAWMRNIQRLTHKSRAILLELHLSMNEMHLLTDETWQGSEQGKKFIALKNALEESIAALPKEREDA